MSFPYVAHMDWRVNIYWTRARIERSVTTMLPIDATPDAVASVYAQMDARLATLRRRFAKRRRRVARRASIWAYTLATASGVASIGSIVVTLRSMRARVQ